MHTSEEDNQQVRNWLRDRFWDVWLGKVNYLHPSGGWGYIEAYDENLELLVNPDNQPVTKVWFRRDNLLELEEGAWVIFKPEDASADEKSKHGNPYHMQAIKGSVKPVIKIMIDLSKHIPTLESIEEHLKVNGFECLFEFGKYLFITASYAHKLEALFQKTYKEKFNKWKEDKEADIQERKAELEKKKEKYQQLEKKLAKEREEIQKAKQKNTEIEDLLDEKRLEIQLYEEEVNEIRKRWGFLPTEPKNNKDEIQFAEFNSEQELLERITAYVEAQGYYFNRNDIVNFYTCLKTGAIIVLAGLSGTGKSSLVRLFAEAVGANFELVPVKATWNDDTDLLGFYNPEKKFYRPTPFLDALLKANEYENQLFFICLDEMNLSRVEYYFSDFLSVLEQDRQLTLYRKVQNREEGNLRLYPPELPIPENVFICGTVNMDETTHPFSDKVLDRVQIIQFENVEFHDLNIDPSVLPVKLSFKQFREYCNNKANSIVINNSWFDELNACLQVGGFHFGYRVKKQIEDYCAHALGSQLFDDLEENDIVDFQIVQKVLPKIQGFKTVRLERMFRELENFFDDKYHRASKKIEMLEKMESINYWELFRYVEI